MMNRHDSAPQHDARRRALLRAALGAGAAGALPGLALAQSDYPSRPITLVVPFPPGGPTDLVARVLAKKLSDQLGQAVVVTNRGGAGGTVGMQAAATSKPDGYTILYNTSSIAMTPHLYKKLTFDVKKDFAPIAATASVPMVLMVHPDIPANDVKSFIEYARKNPGKLSYASAGAGNVTHLGGFAFTQKAGIEATHVPFNGSAPAMVNLVGGQVQYMVNTINDSLAFIKDKRVKALAMTSLERSELLPDVPTLAEGSMPGYQSEAWQGVVAPAGVPADIIQFLNQEIKKAMNSAEVRARLKPQGARVLSSIKTVEDYRKFIDEEYKRWGEVIRAAGAALN